MWYKLLSDAGYQFLIWIFLLLSQLSISADLLNFWENAYSISMHDRVVFPLALVFISLKVISVLIWVCVQFVIFLCTLLFCRYTSIWWVGMFYTRKRKKKHIYKVCEYDVRLHRIIQREMVCLCWFVLYYKKYV